MRQALRILMKDVRHLWPRVAIFIVLAAVYAYIEVLFPSNPMLVFAEGTCGFLLAIAAGFVVLSVVQEDRLMGDSQFWLTRPYSRWSLVLSKTLFVLVLLCLPVLLMQMAALAGAGLSVEHYLPMLLWRQLRFAGTLLLPVAALATVTSSLAEFVTGMLGAAVLLYGTGLGLIRLVTLDSLAWGSVEPFISSYKGITAACLGATACGLQYFRRATLPARWLVAASILLPTFFGAIFSWGDAFARLARQSSPLNTTALVLTLDPGRDPHTKPHGDSFQWGQTDGLVAINIPIQVTGIPAGLQAFSERAQVTLAAPGGQSWSSRWDSLNRIYSVTQGDINKGQVLPGDGGPYWLYVNMDRAFYSKFLTTPIYVQVTVAFTVLGQPTTTKLSISNRRQSLPGDGFCYCPSQNGSVQNLCFAPLRTVDANAIRIESLSSGTVMEDERVEGISSSSTLPNIFSIWERLSPTLGYRLPPAPVQVQFETRQAIAHVERVLDLQGIRLEDIDR
jgi:hypothetical protein